MIFSLICCHADKHAIGDFVNKWPADFPVLKEIQRNQIMEYGVLIANIAISRIESEIRKRSLAGNRVRKMQWCIPQMPVSLIFIIDVLCLH